MPALLRGTVLSLNTRSLPQGLLGVLIQYQSLDGIGREIGTAVNEEMEPGMYEETFDCQRSRERGVLLLVENRRLRRDEEDAGSPLRSMVIRQHKEK